MLQEHIKLKDARCDSVPRNINKKCDQFENRKHSPNKAERVDKKDCRDKDIDRYYSLKLSRSHIQLVDDRNKFYAMLTYLSNQPMIAFDAEWKPISKTTLDVALIQFATSEKIYLLDVISIDIGINDWNNLATQVFNNLEILKIGKTRFISYSKMAKFKSNLLEKKNIFFTAFSPLSDLKMFQKLMPAFSLSIQMLQSYLDLQAFWQKLARIPAFKFPYEGTGYILQQFHIVFMVKINLKIFRNFQMMKHWNPAVRCLLWFTFASVKHSINRISSLIGTIVHCVINKFCMQLSMHSV